LNLWLPLLPRTASKFLTHYNIEIY
jgi:hypothetical protein